MFNFRIDAMDITSLIISLLVFLTAFLHFIFCVILLPQNVAIYFVQVFGFIGKDKNIVTLINCSCVSFVFLLRILYFLNFVDHLK